MTTATTRPLVVDRKALLQGLTTVIPAVAGRGASLPMLSCVRLRRTDDRLRMTGTNLELTIDQTVPAQAIPEDLDVAVNARVLRKVLQASYGDVTIKPDGTALELAWGRTTASLTLQPVEEFPNLRSVEGDQIDFTAHDVELIRKVANFASKDDARPILTGLRFSDEHPAGVAGTDSYRLGVARLSTKIPRAFLLPANVARHLPIRLLDTEGVTATLGDRDINLTFGDTTISSVLIEGEFPRIAPLVPDTSPCNITFDRAELTRAVRTAATLFTDAQPVRFDFDPKERTARLGLACTDVGKIDTVVDFKINDNVPSSSCAFNPGYLAQLLESLAEDTVTLSMTDSLKPVLVREGPWTLLIMPVRVS